jgi:hypothetical protein
MKMMCYWFFEREKKVSFSTLIFVFPYVFGRLREVYDSISASNL